MEIRSKRKVKHIKLLSVAKQKIIKTNMRGLIYPPTFTIEDDH